MCDNNEIHQIKDIRVEMRVRNNLILSMMDECGIKTVAELSRLSQVGQSQLGGLINMKRSPFNKKTEWREEVLRLAEFFKCLPEDIFSETHTDHVLETNRAHAEVSFAEMQYLISEVNSDNFLPENILFDKEKTKQILLTLETLKPREKEIIVLRFGLDGKDEKTLTEIATLLNISVERVRQIEQRALRMLRFPSRRKFLEPLLQD